MTKFTVFNHQSGTRLLLAIASLSVLVTVGCTANQANQSTPTNQPVEIKIDGSSTVYPITTAIANAFQKTPNGDRVTISTKFSGSSAGFRQFCAGSIEISNASRPISKAEVAMCVQNGVGFIELPIAFDALTIAVNPQNTWAQDITVTELKNAWERAAQGKIKTWNQIRATYPNQPLVLFGAGADSGTFDYFNEVITGDRKNSRSDYVASEDDQVLVNGIAQTPGALGYIPHAYYKQSQGTVKALPVDSGNGAVLPDDINIKNATYQPLSRPLFIYINSKSTQDSPQLRAFIEFYLKNAPQLVETVGYLPLPNEAYRLAEIQLTRGEIGTAFKGVPEPNITVAELLRRQTIFQDEQANNP